MFFFVIFRGFRRQIALDFGLRLCDPGYNFIKRGLCSRLNLLPGLVLNRVRDVDRIEVRAT